ncbi:MAG: SGNH/GDSL hydrolase family protein, partial [Candidatus Melainabacteria bacterium]|nr:SGNH/GDSL hydrolase family protein [Candidatus Melainabacteria bacterium]
MNRNIKINILLCLTSIVFSLIFIVIILEARHYLKHKEILNQFWHDPNTRFDSELGWSPIPNRSLNIPSWGTISSNSYGFRSAEIDQNKKQIIILGDSVVWGFGVSDTETFPYYLDKMASRSGYHVSNLAVSGYGIDQYYLFLKRHMKKFKNLQVVILGICTSNDLLNASSNFAYGKRKLLFIKKGD